MDEVTLTSSIRQNLLTTQNATKGREQSAERIATGLKVNTATDDPAAFFKAKELTNRATDLASTKSAIDQVISSVEAASIGAKHVNNLITQLDGIISSARGGNDEQRAAASAQYNVLRNQIDQLVNDVSYNGVNLIGTNPDEQVVNLNEDGSSSVVIEGRSSGAEGLGIAPAEDFNNFATSEDIDRAETALRESVTTLQSNVREFGSNVALLNTRSDYISNLSNTLEEGAAKLVQADLTEEAARQLSSQVRQQLSTQGLQITNESEGLITGLLK